MTTPANSTSLNSTAIYAGANVRVVIGASYILLGTSIALLNTVVGLAIYRVGLLGSVAKKGSPVFILVMCSIVDGVILSAALGLYCGGSVLAGHNLGDGDNPYGTVNYLIIYLIVFPSYGMAVVTEMGIAINRLAVIKRMMANEEVPSIDTADRAFSRRNCLIYASVIYPLHLAQANSHLIYQLFGAPQPYSL
jgi:hypothetical protein